MLIYLIIIFLIDRLYGGEYVSFIFGYILMNVIFENKSGLLIQWDEYG